MFNNLTELADRHQPCAGVAVAEVSPRFSWGKYELQFLRLEQGYSRALAVRVTYAEGGETVEALYPAEYAVSFNGESKKFYWLTQVVCGYCSNEECPHPREPDHGVKVFPLTPWYEGCEGVKLQIVRLELDGHVALAVRCVLRTPGGREYTDLRPIAELVILGPGGRRDPKEER